MASLSQGTKEYWNSRIKEILQEKQKEILAAAGRPDFEEELLEQAFQELVEKLGARQLLDKLNAIEVMFNSTKKAYYDTQKAVHGLFEDYLQAYSSSPVYLSNEAAVKHLIPKKHLNWKELAEQEELGQELFKLNAIRQQIADGIMLATTPAALRDFLGAVAVKLNVDFTNPLK
jgi:hypothetical protein